MLRLNARHTEVLSQMTTMEHAKLLNDDSNTVFQRIATAAKEAIAMGQACGAQGVRMSHAQIAAGLSRFVVYDHPKLVAEFPIAFFSAGIGFFSAPFLALFCAGMPKEKLRQGATLAGPEIGRAAAAIAEIWSHWTGGRQTGITGPVVSGYELRKRLKSLGMEKVSDALDLPTGRYRVEHDERERGRRIESQFREINGLPQLQPQPQRRRDAALPEGVAVVSEAQALEWRLSADDGVEEFAGERVAVAA